jgi:diguanylate cyclase (GGDEF)-like protein
VIYALALPTLWMIVFLVRYRHSIREARDGWNLGPDVAGATGKGDPGPTAAPAQLPSGACSNVHAAVRRAEPGWAHPPPDEGPESAELRFLRTSLGHLPTSMGLLFASRSPAELANALAGICQRVHGQRSRCAVLLVDGDVARVAASAGMQGADGLVVPLGSGQAGFAARTLVTLDQSDFARLSNLDRAAAAQPTTLPPFDVFFPIIHTGLKHPYGVVAIAGLPVKTTPKAQVIQLVCTMASHALAKVEQETIEHNDVRPDALTGLATRRQFDRLARKALAGDDHPMSVCFLEVDLFHKLTDVHGEALGERILSELGTALRRLLHEDEVAARYAEDEFVLLLRSAAAEALLRCESLRLEIGAKRFSLVDGSDVSVTLSGGIAVRPTDGEDLEALLKSADGRLFESRNNGRNQVTIPGLSMQGGGAS